MADQLILNQWLERIDELKIALLKQGGIVDGQYTKITELVAEITSLKEKLAEAENRIASAIKLIVVLNDGFNEITEGYNKLENEYKIITKGRPFTLREIK
jgi:hypothetical protein